MLSRLVPGVGKRGFGAGPMREFWYQARRSTGCRCPKTLSTASRTRPRVPAALLGVGHYAPLEYPEVIAEEVRGFLGVNG